MPVAWIRASVASSTAGSRAGAGSSPASAVASASGRARSSASASRRARSSALSSRWGSIVIGSSSAPGGSWSSESSVSGSGLPSARASDFGAPRRSRPRLRSSAGSASASASSGRRAPRPSAPPAPAAPRRRRLLLGARAPRGSSEPWPRAGLSSAPSGSLLVVAALVVGHQASTSICLRLLGLVRVLRAGVDLQLPQLLAREAVAGQHALDRLADHLLGPALEHLAEGARPQAPGIAAVAVVELVVQLVAGDPDLGGVDHDHEVAGVAVRRVLGLALAAQRVGDLGREPAEGLALGVDHVPVALAVVGCRYVGLHLDALVRRRGTAKSRPRELLAPARRASR